MAPYRGVYRHAEEGSDCISCLSSVSFQTFMLFFGLSLYQCGNLQPQTWMSF